MLFLSRYSTPSAWRMRGMIVATFVWIASMGRAEQTGALTRVVYLPHWVPQAQFAGYYVAQERGFYRDEGLDVEILRGGPEQPASDYVADGRADFGTTFLATAIEGRARGIPFVNIAQIVRKSALMLVALKSSGIESPSEFTGKRVMIWPEFRIQPMALFKKFDVHPRIITQRNTLNLFLRGGAEVASAMWYNEYHLLLNAGLEPDELTLFRYDDYGLNFPEDGIYCLEKTIRERPDVCRAFVRASVKGWLYAFDHEEETLDIVMERVRAANMPTTRVHHRWMLRAMRDIILPDNDPNNIGRLTEEEYETVARELRSAGIVESVPDFKSFYENCAR